MGGKLFVTCTPPDGSKRILAAVDGASGKIAWTREWEASAFRQHADNSFTSASPAVDSKHVYTTWTSPEKSWLVAVSAADGKEIWKADLGPYSSKHGAGSSPVVHGDSVILDFSQELESKEGSYTICVDARTGATRWKHPWKSSNTTSSTPFIYEPAGAKPQVIILGQHIGMASLDLATGTLLWQLPDLLPKRCVASPVLTAGGLLIAQCGEGQSESFVYAVQPGKGAEPPKKTYEVVRTGGYVPSPIVVGDLLYLWKENGFVTCLRAATNEQVWSERVQGPFYASPVAVGGRLYNVTRQGDLVTLAAGEKFESLGRLPLGEGSYSTPAVAQGRLYVRTFTHLVALGK